MLEDTPYPAVIAEQFSLYCGGQSRAMGAQAPSRASRTRKKDCQTVDFYLKILW
jgi:hypothetical protein